MTFEDFKTYCLSKEGVEEMYPFGDMAAWFRVDGKAFAWTFVEMFKMDEELKPAFTFVNCKCNPDQAKIWRAQYPEVHPGWYNSKPDWNAVFMDGDLSDEDFIKMIDHAYDLVTGKRKSVSENHR